MFLITVLEMVSTPLSGVILSESHEAFPWPWVLYGFNNYHVGGEPGDVMVTQ